MLAHQKHIIQLRAAINNSRNQLQVQLDAASTTNRLKMCVGSHTQTQNTFEKIFIFFFFCFSNRKLEAQRLKVKLLQQELQIQTEKLADEMDHLKFAKKACEDRSK